MALSRPAESCEKSRAISSFVLAIVDASTMHSVTPARFLFSLKFFFLTKVGVPSNFASSIADGSSEGDYIGYSSFTTHNFSQKEVNYASEEKDHQKDSNEDEKESSCQKGEEDLRLRALRHRGDSDKAWDGCHPPDVLRSADEAEKQSKIVSRFLRSNQSYTIRKR